MINFKIFFEDFHANKVSSKSILIVLFYRLAAFFAQHENLIIRFIGIPIRILYKLIIELIMGVELPDKTVSGPGLRVFHGIGLVVNAEASLGANVSLRQCTTIGHKFSGEPCPRIGDNVDIGANVIIIGDIDIGDNTIIGAGSVVIKSCPAGSILVGNPAQIIKKRSSV